jgi:predicted phosphodiesterase
MVSILQFHTPPTRLSDMSSQTFRFVHAADLHLDAPVQGLRRASTAITHALGHAPLTAWDALVQLTIDENAAFLLLAGDICDGSERAIPAQLRLVEGLQRLSTHGIRTFIVRGPADPPDRWTAIHRWPDGVHLFSAHGPESVAVTTASGCAATIHGLGYSTDRSANRLARFRRGAESGIHIALVHEGLRAGDAQANRALSDMQASGIDYWALGHDHKYRQLTETRPWIVYPGTLQGRGLKADETGPKGAVVVTVTDGAITSASHRPLDAVRIVRTQLDASTLVGPTDFRVALSAQSMRLRSEHPARTIVTACDVVGRRPAWMGVQTADSIWDRLLEDIRKEENGAGTPVWWDSLSDMTEIRETHSDDDAAVYVRRLIDVFRRAPASLDRLVADQNVAPGTAIGAGQTLDTLEVNDLLGRAERVALSLLEPRQQ